MITDKNQLDPLKRQNKSTDKRSIILDTIRKEIERFHSIESLKQSSKDEYHLYRRCLIFTACTNNALCELLGIPAADGMKYCKLLLNAQYKAIWKINLVSCPFTDKRAWRITTNPKRYFDELDKINPPSPSPKHPL